MMKIKLLSGLLLCLTYSAFGQQDPGKRTDAYIRQQLRQQHIAGLSIAVVKDGKIIKTAGYGLANAETGTTATPRTVYKIASVSKQFIAAGMMLLVQQHKLALDDQVRRYIREVPKSWKTMTIRELLNHSAGLPLDAPGFEPYQLQPDSVTIRSLFAVPLLFEPGEKFSYSNADYFVAAEIIRRVSRMTWDEFIDKNLFAPAGMTETQVTNTTVIVPNRSGGYLQKDGKWQNAEDWIAVRPSGAFLSTVLDMAKWDAALYQNTILSDESKQQLWSPVKLTNGTTIPYGLGWGLSPFQGHKRVFHDGGLPGFSADFERFTDDRLCVIVLCNTEGVDAGQLAVTVAGFYDQSLQTKGP